MSLIHAENSVDESEVKPASDCESIVVVCASDDNYAMPLAVTMRSVVENLKEGCKVFFYIIDGGITDFNKQKILSSLIQDRCEVEFIQIPNSLTEDIREAHEPKESGLALSKSDHVSIASFYRLLLPELLPSQLEKVIYLDCDLVIKGDLLQLWQIDFGEDYILAVRDTWIPLISSPNGRLNYQELGIDPDAPYFNAGILVIDLAKWRDDKLGDKAIKYFVQNLKYIGWYDQGLLNALFIGKWGQLDPRWNFNATSFYDYSSRDYFPWRDSNSLLSEDVYNELVRNPYIIHFVSEKKPWVSRHCPRKEEFFEYVDRTKWSGWRLTIWRRLRQRLSHESKAFLRKISH